MELFDFLFNNQSDDDNSNTPKECPCKEDLLRQINCISSIRNSFRNSMLDNVRKARMVNNMTSFKAVLVFAYDAVFKYGVAKDVISSDEDFMAAANIGVILGKLLVTGEKSQIHAIMSNTLESWESHSLAISTLAFTDSNITSMNSTINDITKTLNYLTQF